MARKKPGYIDTSKDLVINTALIAGMLSSGSALISGDTVLPDSVLLAGLLGSAATLINRNLSMPKIGNQSRQLTNMQYSPFAISQGVHPDPDMQRQTARFTVRPEREFHFVGDKLNGPIPESLLLDFVKVAHRRQINAEFGNGLHLMETSTGRLKRLTANQIMSKQYFCKRWSRCILPPVYDDIISVLWYTGFVTGPPKQGRSPRFVDVRRYGPVKIVQEAQEWWEYLFPVTPPTSQARARFWRVFGS